MTIHGTGDGTILECNYCETVVDRWEDIKLPNGLFIKKHRLICDDCSKKLGFFTIEQRKILSRSLECLWDRYNKIINENSHYLPKEFVEALNIDISSLREMMFNIDREIRSVENKKKQELEKIQDA